jgi:hypothetical protein
MRPPYAVHMTGMWQPVMRRDRFKSSVWWLGAEVPAALSTSTQARRRTPTICDAGSTRILAGKGFLKFFASNMRRSGFTGQQVCALMLGQPLFANGSRLFSDWQPLGKSASLRIRANAWRWFRIDTLLFLLIRITTRTASNYNIENFLDLSLPISATINGFVRIAP